MKTALVGLAAAVAASVLSSACQSFPDPPVTFVAGLRVLGLRADPPQVAPGGTTQITALIADTAGLPIDVAWSRCLLAPLAGQTVHPTCVKRAAMALPNVEADDAVLEALGGGATIAVNVPAIAPGTLGRPDATGGVYVPLLARVTDGADVVTAAYRLRLDDGTGPANTNPRLTAVLGSLSGGGPSTDAAPLDPAAPLVVHPGDAVTLQALLAEGSAEAYLAPDGTTADEMVTTSWFATAGSLTFERTSALQPQTTLHLTERLPTAPAAIDLYAVARDGRGGADFVHHTLWLE